MREDAGLRAIDLAAKAGVSCEALRALERGEWTGIKLGAVARIAYALGVAPADLVPGFASRPARQP